jgi:hypothetical protein
MSKELDAAKAALDADLANTKGAMSQEEIAKVVEAITDPDEQKAFFVYAVGKMTSKVSSPSYSDDSDIDLDRVTEFFTSLTDEPNNGKGITRERFDEIAKPLTRSEKIYAAKMLIKEQTRRATALSEGMPNPLATPGVRPTAIREYVDKLGPIIKAHGAPTRDEYADITSHMNDVEKSVIQENQMKMFGGPLPFRDDHRPLN